MQTDKEMYFPQKYVDSHRILYTPSSFARTNLLHLQEIGRLTALKAHTSKRKDLPSYLFFIVENGSGKLTFNSNVYVLRKGDCVFVNCMEMYSHETSEDFWSLKWVHFYGPQMKEIYGKYVERGGKPVFRPENLSGFERVWSALFETADSSDYLRDMRINEGISCLLTLIMEESWNPDSENTHSKRKDLVVIRDFLHEHYAEKISLDELSERFYINKFYLTRIFREQYGVSINQYLLQLRITRAKQALRFTDETLENIGRMCGLGSPFYFSRTFKRVEGVSPSEFRHKWQS